MKTLIAPLLAWIDRLPLFMLLVIGGLLAAAPFTPEPHLVEKLRMLRQGTLTRPIDIFDLVLHGTPVVFIVLKLWTMARRRPQP